MGVQQDGAELRVCPFPSQNGDHAARANLQQKMVSWGLIGVSLELHRQKTQQKVPTHWETLPMSGSLCMDAMRVAGGLVASDKGEVTCLDSNSSNFL